MISARIDASISLDATALPDSILQQILAELTMRNPTKDRAVTEKIRGADALPDALDLWDARGNSLVIPRGFAHRLEEILVASGESVLWDSGMTILPPSQHRFRDWPTVELRDYQAPARDALLDWGQGILKAPTSSGKTFTTLEGIRWAGQRSLVLVGKTSLARQWEAEAKKLYGYETGYIGEGVWREADLTIATWQTLWARAHEIPAEFWASWGLVVGDEIHHAAADSLSALFGRFPAFYRWGVSATPRWDPLLFPIVRAVVGPVIFRVSREVVGDRMMTPTIKMIPTNFAAEFLPTHFVERKRVQNNFSDIMAALVDDYARNHLIAHLALREAEAGHHVLIITRRVDHIKRFVELLEHRLPIGQRLHALKGGQKGHDAQRIARAIEASEEGTVLISTVAEEALDMPRLDRLFMAFPARKIPLIEQQVGRILRLHEQKTDAVVYDFADDEVGPLKAQRRERSQFYARRRWIVQRIEKEELYG